MTPRLNISRSQKTDKWGKEVMKFYLGKGLIDQTIKHEMDVLYRLAAGYLEEADYSHVLNPLGEVQKQRPELQGDPAKMRNYDILSPVINSYMGDFILRNTKFQAVDPTYSLEEERARREQELVYENLLSEYREEINKQQGIDTEVDNTQVPQEEIQNEVKRLRNTNAIKGQKALDYIRYYNEMDRKYRLGYYDYITIGRVFTYRDAFKDETYFDVLNPRIFNYYGSPDTEFIEDCEAAWVEYTYTGSEVIDKYGDILTKEATKYIESSYGNSLGAESSTQFTYTDNLMVNQVYNDLMGNLDNRINPNTGGLIVTHMNWKARRKLGRLIQYDNIGNEAGYIEVDEDFVPRLDEKVIWESVNETWEGYDLDGKYWFGIRRLPLQGGSIGDNKAKLSFNGRTFGNRSAIPDTPVKKGKYFQELHNIVKYRMERTLAKNKDKLIPMPIGAINDSKMDIYQTMYYADYDGWLFYDETNPRTVNALSAIRPIDASLNAYIKDMHNIAYEIRQEYYETLGVPRQKLGNIMASDDVGNTNTALNQSNILTEDLMITFEEVQERDYQMLINNSKFVWIDGKNETFSNSDGELDQLSLEGSEWSEVPHTVFIKGTKEEQRKLEALRQQVQPLAQNGYGPTALGDIIGSNNYEDLMRRLDYHEEKLKKETQQTQQNALASDQEIAKQTTETKQAELEFKYYDGDKDRESAERIAAMNIKGTLLSTMMGGEEGSGYDEAIAAVKQADVELANLNVKREEIQAKREDSYNKLKIAETNKNKYDK